MTEPQRIKHIRSGNDTEIVKVTDRVLQDADLSKHTFNTKISASAKAVLSTWVSDNINDTPEGVFNFIKNFLLRSDRYNCSIDANRFMTVTSMVGHYDIKKYDKDQVSEKERLNIDE